MKQVEVVAAIIQKDNAFLATQRGYGEFQGMWEFPGGKIEEHEDQEEALLREIEEELNIQVKAERFLCTVKYDYPSFALTMHCYLCEIIKGEVQLNEHMAARWLYKAELDEVDWLPADVAVVQELKKMA